MLETQELSPDPQIFCSQQHQGQLYYIARSAIWIGNLYLIVRLTVILAASRTWQMWVILFVEVIFIRR